VSLRPDNDGAPRWRFAAGSAIGTSHVRSGDPCQDAYACEVIEDDDGDEVLVAVVSDGAGSASLSHFGSAAVCRFVIEAVRRHLSSGLRVGALSRDVALGITLGARERLRELADEAQATVRDFACTLVVGVIATDVAAFFQVGDGAVIVSQRYEPDEYSWVFWPERGEYANTTVFLSDNQLPDHLMHDVTPGALDEIAIFTDGIQSLVLDYKAQVAHAPFFRQMLAPLRAQDETGRLPELSTSLERYLSSGRVNERTDDDKTLILATRRRV
jgi:serine/threonine protein phosphatase PrpC